MIPKVSFISPSIKYSFIKVYNAGSSKEIKSNSIEAEAHQTKPKPRYTEASLIKELEELGIGRPSTYVSIIDTLKARDYIKLEEKKFRPTEMGVVTTDKLQEFFSGIINVDYTRDMEEDLDKIADGDKVWNKVLEDFYAPFEDLVSVAFKDMEKKAPEETGEMCPECGSPLVIRKGKYNLRKM